MKDCIFCKIADGSMDSAKIWEDDEFIAILDVNPNMEGMTLVLPKRHYDSYAFDMPDEAYQKLMLASKKVVKLLERAFHVTRVAMVMEGMGIDHAHTKLYPLHGVTEKFKEMWAKEKVFFKKYEGYISTQLGPEAKLSELKKLAERIRKSGS
jgi:diadenosine tetraphosphate (Ap4A) HIT family hydrolase